MENMCNYWVNYHNRKVLYLSTVSNGTHINRSGLGRLACLSSVVYPHVRRIFFKMYGFVYFVK